MLLGCIGDDFTGSSDLANTLAKGGMRVTQYCGVPGAPAEPGVEAGVVALKSRTIAPGDAVAQSLSTLEWLRKQGCQQYFFKYCSTFDSRPEGNIGPVADALIAALGADRVIVCPAFPATGRYVYQGHLFVGDRLLSESGMQNHPLTPMTDPDIRRWLAPQTAHPVGHVGAPTVLMGPDAIRTALAAEHAAGHVLVVVDAIRDADLMAIGEAARDLALVTGGSGVALGLPENFRRAGLIAGEATAWDGVGGPCAILSGSCSRATNAQVARHAASYPAMEIRADAVMRGETTAEAVAEFLLGHPETLPLAYSSADPEAVQGAQARFGREAVAAAIEGLFAETARRLVAGGITRLISAGGETSGAVVEGVGIDALEIGPEIDPGVPALKVPGRNLALALKSGNFGSPDFFEKASRILEGA
ncbi:four-carbon acid sugar kinase family protein [Limibaculum sp. M0105]|uniref:3-oxo-tetronate kinase n=1 Tax=Thermohalobaculum xanthum TaxID=2753746 RepID=A0A8J7M5C5_9RHOB|nr:3-oxo-tetronate kinase [Thermohalobaculum xanthum]MBK0398062.1 four-carbon acid sugar kinase family protein [Thermohalobaculum xanthum]